MTTLGRRVVRAGIGELPASRPSKDLLADWAWKYLALLYQAEHGIAQERFGIRTLEYLENRHLVAHDHGMVRLSDQGRQHYEAHWMLYRELYRHRRAQTRRVRRNGQRAGNRHG
jgi:hypothetical protein